MAVTQTGAVYRNRSHIFTRDRLLGEALDDIASRTQAVSNQTNADVSGSTSPPSAPNAISVTAKDGFANVQISHASAPEGTAYLLEYATTPNFQNPVQVDNGISKNFSQYLKGQRLYFRAASTFYTSPASPWIYYGGQANPIPVSF